MRHFLKTGVAFLSLSLMGCSGIDLYEPATVKQGKLQVQEQVVLKDMAMADVTEGYLQDIAQHHARYGDTPLDIVVTYDPRSYRNTAMEASNKAASIVNTLRDNGVQNVNPSVLPVKGQGDEARVLISYNAVMAKASQECSNDIPGLNGSALEYNPNYKLGCSIDNIMAKQIAKPSHLRGRGAVDSTTDGRATANKVNAYRTGAQNEPLEGESASGSD